MPLGFRSIKVLVVGDIMLDTFVYGNAERLSPEAPVPVIARTETRIMPGGAANVARNIASLGGNAILVGLVGADHAGTELLRLIGDDRIISGMVSTDTRPTTQKMRIIAGSQQVCRLDDESRADATSGEEVRLCREVAHFGSNADVIVISDYSKGVVTDAVIKAAVETGKPVLVDPKRRAWTAYAGAKVIKPNARELSEASSMPCRTDDEIKRAVARAAGDATVLVTRAERGMTLVHRGQVTSVAAHAHEVFDVSGAGDTVMAAFALAYAAQWSLEDAMRLANVAGGIVVGKAGTATVGSAELFAAWDKVAAKQDLAESTTAE